MFSFFRQCVVWLAAGAFLCASVGDGGLHLLLDLSAVPVSGGSSAAHEGPAHACCSLHSRLAAERHQLSPSGLPTVSAEDETSGHDSGACPICQFSSMAKAASVQSAPLTALLPTTDAVVARPVVFFARSRPAHLPRGPPHSLVLSVR